MQTYYILEHKKGTYVSPAFYEVFDVMYVLSDYDKHDSVLPKNWTERQQLEKKVYNNLLESGKPYKNGSFTICIKSSVESEVGK